MTERWGEEGGKEPRGCICERHGNEKIREWGYQQAEDE